MSRIGRGRLGLAPVNYCASIEAFHATPRGRTRQAAQRMDERIADVFIDAMESRMRRRFPRGGLATLAAAAIVVRRRP